MDIKVLQLIDGAKNAAGLTVIIDVFRAFTVEAYAMAMGAEKVIPVGQAELAYRLKQEHPEYVLAGERGGKIMPGFDTGNSPWQLQKLDLKGKTVVHTTSAGTQGIANAVNACEILGGALVNARAIANYIRNSGAKDVSLVCMGYAGEYETQEDTLCAEYIKSLLLGTQLDMPAGIAEVKATSGAKFFDPAQNEVFPREDFFMCTELNKFDFVLRLKQGADGLAYMEKIPAKGETV